jgi:hypothetical protein
MVTFLNIHLDGTMKKDEVKLWIMPSYQSADGRYGFCYPRLSPWPWNLAIVTLADE